jgi:hypothetical protein
MLWNRGSFMLDDADLADLARTCARRFPRADDQRAIATAAGISGEVTEVGEPDLAWQKLLQTAQREGKLAKLAAELVRSAPGDANFVAVARALGDVARPARPPTGLIVAGAGLAAVVGLGLLVAFFLGNGDEQAPKENVVLKTDHAPATTSTGAVDPKVSAAAPAPAEVPVAAPSAVPDTTPPPPGEPPTKVSAATTPQPPKASTESPTRPASVGSCRGTSGSVVGYWYAGTAKPGNAGETITLGRDARVRKSYPQASNGHNAATPEVCVLTRGTVQVLTQAPIDASRGHWWVPVVAP